MEENLLKKIRACEAYSEPNGSIMKFSCFLAKSSHPGFYQIFVLYFQHLKNTFIPAISTIFFSQTVHIITFSLS